MLLIAAVPASSRRPPVGAYGIPLRDEIELERQP
jgi:hypothetical protein